MSLDSYYPFEKRLSQLIKELEDMKAKHGDVWVECFAEGCYCGCNVQFSPAKPAVFRGTYLVEPAEEDVVLIGET